MKSERHRRRGFHVPQNHQHARRFARFNFGYDNRFIRKDRARAPGQSHLIDMRLKQPGENPSAKSARQRKRGQQQRPHIRPVIGQNSAQQKDECPHGQAESRGDGGPADGALLRHARRPYQ